MAVAMRQMPNELRSAGRNRSLASPVRISCVVRPRTGSSGRNCPLARSVGALSDSETIHATGNSA